MNKNTIRRFATPTAAAALAAASIIALMPHAAAEPSQAVTLPADLGTQTAVTLPATLDRPQVQGVVTLPADLGTQTAVTLPATLDRPEVQGVVTLPADLGTQAVVTLPADLGTQAVVTLPGEIHTAVTLPATLDRPVVQGVVTLPADLGTQAVVTLPAEIPTAVTLPAQLTEAELAGVVTLPAEIQTVVTLPATLSSTTRTDHDGYAELPEGPTECDDATLGRTTYPVPVDVDDLDPALGIKAISAEINIVPLPAVRPAVVPDLDPSFGIVAISAEVNPVVVEDIDPELGIVAISGEVEYRDEDGNLVDPIEPMDGIDRSDLARDGDFDRSQYARTADDKGLTSASIAGISASVLGAAAISAYLVSRNRKHA
ncbi:MAG: hypothetical protein LBB58_03710 [Cellulomonadaceae bacterium]|jgi:hypothetical protein|nr:hypothetical protein [Cellulomonadaceae bacterium]